MGETFFVYNNTIKVKDKNISESENLPQLRSLSCAFFASLGLFCNGAFVGWSSQATAMLPETFSARQKDWLSCGLAFGAGISPLVVQKFWQKTGMKFCIIFSSILMVIASGMLTVSTCYWSLFTARIAGGCALGVIQLLIPVYIHDISTGEQKRTYNCILQTQFAAGVLTMYITGLFSSFILTGITSAFMPLIFAICFSFMPESPRYLCIQEKTIENAKNIISRFRDIDTNEIEHNMRLWSNEKNRIRFIFNGTIGARLLITVFGLIIVEQLIGAISILFCMHKVLTLTHGDYTPDVTAIICCTIFVISIPLPNICGYKLKTKILLLSSTICMGLSLFALGISCHYQATFGYGNKELTYLPLYLMGAFYFFFAIGPYRLTWFFIEKLLPEDNYMTMRSLLVSTSWLIICGITRILPRLINVIGIGWLFWYMAIMCFFSSIFVSIYVPRYKCVPEEHKLFSSSSSSSENSETNSENDIV